MATNVRRLGLGAALLLAGSVGILLSGTTNAPLPKLVAGVAILGLAAGSLLVGTSGEGAPA